MPETAAAPGPPPDPPPGPARRGAPGRAAPGPVGPADLAAIAIGGGIGSVARYLLSQAFPSGGGFPWAIFAINVSGCFALGLLMVFLLEVWPPRRLLRPFLAIGLIGGYTTFSTYAAGIFLLIRAHAPAIASAYALTSILAGLAAVWCGAATALAISGPRAAAGPGPGRDPGELDPGELDPDRLSLPAPEPGHPGPGGDAP